MYLPYIVSGADSYFYFILNVYFKKNKIFLNILWEFLATIFKKWLAKYYYYKQRTCQPQIWVYFLFRSSEVLLIGSQSSGRARTPSQQIEG